MTRAEPPVFREAKTTRRLPPLRVAFAAVVAACSTSTVAGREISCAPPASTVVATDEYSLEVEPDTGASGDIVEVGVFLRSRLASRGFIRLRTSICHDPNVAELVGPARYSEELRKLAITRGIHDVIVDEQAGGPNEPVGHGIFVEIDFDGKAYDVRFSREEPLLLFTLCFRLRGKPGAFTELRLCDEELATRPIPCVFNELHSWSAENPAGWHFVSEKNDDGLLDIVSGPATRETCSPLSPRAAIYAFPQSDEDVNLRIEVGNAGAARGTSDVPVDLYVTADREYTALTLPVDFNERHLRLAWVEERLPGAVTVVNNRNDRDGDEEATTQREGWILAAGGLGASRLAREGERILAATLHFRVLPEAAGVSETPLRVVTIEDVRGPDSSERVFYRAGVTVHHQLTGGGGGFREAAPMSVTEGRIFIDPELRSFLRGDPTDDGKLNITDGILILGHLFQGEGALSCEDSADVNNDGVLNITDVVFLLQFLFTGTESPPPPSSRCGPDPVVGDPSDDGLRCASYTSCEAP